MNWTGSNPSGTTSPGMLNQSYNVGTRTDPNRYDGLWRDKKTLAYVEIQDVTGTSAALPPTVDATSGTSTGTTTSTTTDTTVAAGKYFKRKRACIA